MAILVNAVKLLYFSKTNSTCTPSDTTIEYYIVLMLLATGLIIINKNAGALSFFCKYLPDDSLLRPTPVANSTKRI